MGKDRERSEGMAAQNLLGSKYKQIAVHRQGEKQEYVVPGGCRRQFHQAEMVPA